MRQALIHNSTSSASIRDDFSSHGGSTIDLGYFKVIHVCIKLSFLLIYLE